MSPPIFRISMLLTGTFLVVLKLTYFNKGLLVILGNAATYDSLAGEEVYRRRRQTYGEWQQWSPWSLCVQQAGGTSQTRTRQCLTAFCGSGESTQARSCLGSTYPQVNTRQNVQYDLTSNSQSINNAASVMVYVNAEWQAWSPWTECSGSPSDRGQAFRTRWRVCDRGSCSSSNIVCIPCQGAAYEQQVCFVNQSDNTNTAVFRDQTPRVQSNGEYCYFAPWSVWSMCSATCGKNGRRYRARSCICSKNGNQRCVGPPVEDQLCTDLPPCDTQTWSSNPHYSPPGANGEPGYPCSLCPPRYPLPCFMCLNLSNPVYG